jgi:hypothetical protein
VPKTKNYASIDARIPVIGAFQMTVGKKHDIKGGIAYDLARGSQEVLPPLYYHSFTKKLPQDIKQYVIMIPYPE